MRETSEDKRKLYQNLIHDVMPKAAKLRILAMKSCFDEFYHENFNNVNHL